MLAASLMSLLVAAAPAESRRYAIAVGDNLGDSVDEPLRFAEADAQSFLRTLQDVGDVRPGDAVALLGVTAQGFSEALSRLQKRMQAEVGQSGQLVIYVSSHADEGELHLNGTHLALRDLSSALKAAPASVALLIVDSCRSGALTRLKGLAPLPGFSIEVQLPEVHGRVVITSSGADEYAQESDSYRGSYFTHHLIAALRGAADLSHDGQVTLQEAYSYAYRRTVETTFATRAGTQHPSYLVDLKGRGDLVLSDLSHVDGKLILDVDDPGQWIIARRDDGAIVSEFEKPAGRTVFAISPGAYLLRMKDGEETRETEVEVPLGGEAWVSDAQLGRTALLSMTRKGGGEALTLALAGSVQAGAVGDLPPLPGGMLLARWDRPPALFDSWTGALGFSGASANGTGSFLENELSAQVGVGHRWEWRWLLARLAFEGGASVVVQSNVPSGAGSRVSTAPFAGLRGDGELRLGGPVWLLLSVFGGPALTNADDAWGVSAKLQASLGVAFAL